METYKKIIIGGVIVIVVAVTSSAIFVRKLKQSIRRIV